MIVEIAGIPRVGKTSVIKRIQNSFPYFTIHPEIFNLVPFPNPTAFNYNQAYAQICINRAKSAWKDTKHSHLFDRGILDRLAFSDALYKCDYISSKEHLTLISQLKPHIKKRDITIIFNTSIEESIKYIKRPKNHFSQKRDFIETAFESYQLLGEKYGDLFYVPQLNESLDKRAEIINELIDYLH